ncbi:ribosomal protein S5 domain 2-like protein [Martensiomyces pterosporus]|nr:ribosomal protein S5 domain 2-like protein [Martensiomyces pterosporus]
MASLLLSPAEQDYITRGVEKDLRADGRGNLDRREVALRVGMISQANGSARCRIGNLGVGTDVLVGIKAEVNTWAPGDPEDAGTIECSVECSPSAAQAFEGRGAEEINVELTQLLDRIFNGPQSGVDMKKLCIIPKQAYWVLHIDALVLDVKGSIADTLVWATRAALLSTKLPRVVVETITDENGEMQAEFDVVDDPEDMTLLEGAENLPIAVTFNQIGKRYVVDASDQEEAITQAKLTVAVSPKKEVCAIQKGGVLRGFPPSLLTEILQTAQRVAKEELVKFDRHYAEAKKYAESQSDEPSTGSTFLVSF